MVLAVAVEDAVGVWVVVACKAQLVRPCTHDHIARPHVVPRGDLRGLFRVVDTEIRATAARHGGRQLLVDSLAFARMFLLSRRARGLGIDADADPAAADRVDVPWCDRDDSRGI